jgi:hypothetical protein
MNIKHKTVLLCTVSAFLLVACGPKKEEKAPPMPEQADHMNKPKAPTVTPSPASSEKLEQQNKLKREEDEVMDVVPG